MGKRVEPTIIGERFGRLVVVGDSFQSPGGAKVDLVCDCGKTSRCFVFDLRSGNTKSCGCLKADTMSKNMSTHGSSKTKLYRIWEQIKKRCFRKENENYRWYGGKGITVCHEWLDFLVFRNWAEANGYSDCLEIDRKDVNGNYCPDNCRWVTHAKNMEVTSKSVFVEAFGERKTIKQWSKDERCKIGYKTLWYRISVSGMTPEKAIASVKDEPRSESGRNRRSSRKQF